MNSLTVRSCAKINLTLDVFSKRPDGYHGVASVMQAIGLHDVLHLTRQTEPGLHFTCDAPDDPAIPTDASNLVVRAAQSLLDLAHANGQTPQGGFALHLVKRVPSQAGLGGGSGDAAAALRGMDALLGLHTTPADLQTLAASLGSDVPFFLHGGTMTARGRGETLTPLPDVPSFWLVIVKPEQNVSTGWAYDTLDSLPDRPSHRATRRMEEAIQAGDWERVLAFQSNDFEQAVFAHFPSLAWLRDELQMAGALTARLCGSGAALYGVADNETGAQRLADRMRRTYPHVYIATTLTATQCNPLLVPTLEVDTTAPDVRESSQR